jgi:hypothetical protein
MRTDRIAALVSMCLLAACSKPKEQTPQSLASSAAPQPSLAAAPMAVASPAPGVPRSVKESNERYEFEYAYPAAVGAIPALKTMLDADLDKQKAALIASAREQQAVSKKQGFDYIAVGNWTEWKVVTDLPTWLSLSADISSFEGGAHPNHGFDALLWDKRTNQRRDPTDLFTARAALSRVIGKDFCAALDKQRAEKRGAPIDPKSQDEFDQCIDPVANTVILGSSNHQTFDRIGILVAPYEAGPYVEGDYEVTLPVTDAVLATVKPEYRSSFAVKR